MNRFTSSFGLQATVGAVAWLCLLGYLHPLPTNLVWAQLLLLLAVFVLVPLGMKTVSRNPRSRLESICLHATGALLLPCALAFACSFFVSEGIWAASLACGWFVVTLLVAGIGVSRLWYRESKLVAEGCIAIGMIYLVVGGGWAVISRAGLRPLDFEPTIVLLTAIHFHYAGFLLPLFAGLAIREKCDGIALAAGIGVVVGVPLVAAGITATQLGLGPWLECAAAWITAVSGSLTAYIYWRLSRDPRIPRIAQGLWFLCATSLAFGMILAAMYGMRFYLELSWLDIPWMRALHGTANAIGFGLGGLLGWQFVNRNSSQ